MMPCYGNTHSQNGYIESKPGGRDVYVFSATCGLDGFMSVLRGAGIALLFHPAVELGAEAGLDIGKRRVLSEIFQFVRIFGRVVKLLGGPVHVLLANAVQVLAAAKKDLACGYGR